MLTLTPQRVIADVLEATGRELTDRNAAVGAAEVDVALGNGRHAELVVGPGEERSKSASEDHVTVPHGTTDSHAHLRADIRERSV